MEIDLNELEECWKKREILAAKIAELKEQEKNTAEKLEKVDAKITKLNAKLMATPSRPAGM